MSTIIIMAFRYLWRRKLRTLLTTLAVVFGVAVMFAGNVALPGILETFRRMSLQTAHAAELTVTSTTGASFSSTTLDAVRTAPGVAAASGLLRRQISLSPTASSDLPPSLELVGLHPTTALAVRPFAIKTGRFLLPRDQRAAVLANFPNTDGITAGRTITLPTANGVEHYTVVGVLDEPSVVGNPQILLPLADVQRIVAQPGLINTIEIGIQPGAQRDSVAAAVLQKLGSSFQQGAIAGDVDTYGSVQVGYAIFNLLGLLALFVGAFLIFNTFRTIVVERQHDLGMLRAIGANRRQVTRTIVVESLVQGSVGTIIGLLVGYGFAAAMIAGFNRFIRGYFPGIHVSLNWNTRAFLLAAGFGLLTTLGAGYLPARSAGRLSPIAALRPQPVVVNRRAARRSGIAGVITMLVGVGLLVSARTAAFGAILFLGGLVIATPALIDPLARIWGPLVLIMFRSEGDVARSNLLRQTGRAAITASTLTIGLAVFVLSSATTASLNSYINDLFTRSFTSDFLLLPQALGVYSADLGAGPALAEQLRSVRGVAAVGSVRQAASVVDGKAISVMGIDPKVYPTVAALTFKAGQPDQAYAALAGERAAIANPLMAAALGKQPGATLSIATATGTQAYKLVAVADDGLNLKINTLFISQHNLEQDFHKRDDMLLLIKMQPGTDLTATEATLRSIVAPYPQFNLKATAEFRRSLLDQTTAGLRLFYVMALIILIPAALGLLNTLTINVLERTREIGVIRAVGGSRRQVRRMVRAEALLLGFVGAMLGALAGVAMSYGFVGAFGAIGWTLPFRFPLLGIIAAVVLAISLALIVVILPARNAARLDIIRALQYE